MAELENDGERMVPELHKQTVAYPDHMVRYRAPIKFCKNKIVLDIACGSGYGSKLISKDANKVYGVDVSEDAIKYAKEKYSAKNIQYLLGDGEAVPLKDNTVDVIVSFETIEHIKNFEKFITECKRVLRNDGVMVLSTPNKVVFPKGNEYHLHEFEYEEFKQLSSKYFNFVKEYYQSTGYLTFITDSDFFPNDSVASISLHNDTSIKTDQALFFYFVLSDKTIDQKLNYSGSLAEIYNPKEEQKQVNEFSRLIKLEADNKRDISWYKSENKRLTKELNELNIIAQKRLESIENRKPIKVVKRIISKKSK